MNKVALAIRLLEILYSQGKQSRKALAEMLEVNERKVLALKEELEVAGYTIISETGKNGGYTLDSNYLLPTFDLSQDQKLALNHTLDYLKTKQDFVYLNALTQVVEKLQLVSNTQHQSSPIVYQNEIEMDAFLKDLVPKMETAINSKKRIKLDYIGLNANSIKSYVVEPYWVFYFEKAYYLIGFEISRNDFRVFKLVKQRLKNIEFTSERFVALDYKLKDIIGKMNLVKNELFEVEFLVKGKEARLLYEKKIGYNDKKEWINKETLKITTTTEGLYFIKKMLLSIIGDVEVVRPVKLKNEIIKELKKGLQYYD